MFSKGHRENENRSIAGLCLVAKSNEALVNRGDTWACRGGILASPILAAASDNSIDDIGRSSVLHSQFSERQSWFHCNGAGSIANGRQRLTWVGGRAGRQQEGAHPDPAVSNPDFFTVAVFYGFIGKDVEVSTRFKTLSGNADPGGGLVVRYKDKDNNYFVRADARKNNICLFRVIGGKQTQFAGANVNVSVDEWHQLALSVKGSHFKVTYEGKPLFEADDPMIGNAGQDGYCGLYADSVTEFEMLIGTEK
ncbi:MAG TPA: hypothetical protein VFC46_18385 [Humisphaera sp.]|nr:hypothetical protein [Humisphaera sp.]